MGVDPSGLDALILYGPDHNTLNRMWRDIATNWAHQYTAKTGKVASVVFVTNNVDIETALATHGNLDTLVYVGHAGVAGTYSGSNPPSALFLNSPGLPGSANVESTDVAGWPTKNVQPHAFIMLAGCGTASRKNHPRPLYYTGPGLAPGVPTMAQAVAKHFKNNVWAFDIHISFITGWRAKPLTYGGWLTAGFSNAHYPVYPVLVKP